MLNLRTQFADLKSGLICDASQRFGTISPCGSRRRLEDCFTYFNGELLFWFNTADGSTHVLSAMAYRPLFRSMQTGECPSIFG